MAEPEGRLTAGGGGPGATREWRGFVHHLSLERLSGHRYAGAVQAGRGNRAFGGHLTAHALLAAATSGTPGRRPLSLHATFLAEADVREPVEYVATVMRRGRSFERWRVDASQSAGLVLSCVVSLHEPEPGPEHSVRCRPDVAPDLLTPTDELLPRGANPELLRGLEIRPGPRWRAGDPAPAPYQSVWMRCRERLPPDPHLAWGVLVWASDLGLSRTADLPYRERAVRRVGASLDHVVHFHEPLDLGRWWLYHQVSPVLSGGRALSTGAVHDGDGRLCMSVTQQSLLRISLAPMA